MFENQSIILEQVRNLISKGGVVVFTGAGISVESGVPPFRGESGLWQKYNPDIYANFLGLGTTFLIHPEKVAGFVMEIYETVLNAVPSPAHLTIARFEERGFLDVIITQNIDNLHEEGGSKKIIELHGNLFCLRCLKCGKRKKMSRNEIIEMISSIRENTRSRIKLFKTFLNLFPKCLCGGQMRPDIVLFGESLPEGVIESSFTAIDKCKTFLMIGTSGVVFPAASLPYYAHEKGKKIMEINNEESSLSAIVDYKLIGKAGEILPVLI